MLDLRRPDAIAGAGDHIILAADVPEITVGILFAEITGEQELSGVFFRGRFRIAPILNHGARVRLAYADDAALPARHFLALLVDDANVKAWRGPPHRSRTDRKQFCVGADHEIAFGLAVDFMRLDAEHRAY